MKIKKGAKYSIFVVSVIAILSGIFIWSKISYKGNDRVILLNSGGSYTSLNIIIQRPEFKNKIVYVDVWGTSCPSCFEEFKNYTPQLTEHYINSKDIAFLYICIDRHPLPEVRWKGRIEKFKPNGYHILVKADEEAKLSKEIIGEAVDNKYFPYQPCYFIVNKNGKIPNRPTLDPGKGEFRPSDKILLYNKLDSLIKL